MKNYSELAEILLTLESVMREQGLWRDQIPTGDALASQQPFCIDTLTFPEWLQFIFSVRVKYIIEKQEPIPRASGIVPMAEEYFRSTTHSSERIINLLRDFDGLIQERDKVLV